MNAAALERTENERSAARLRAAFREVALAVMTWEAPLTQKQIDDDLERYGHIAAWRVWRSDREERKQ